MEKDRDTDGQFKSGTSDAEILAAVRAHEPAATSEVAGEVDMTRQGADQRLRRLRDDGQVNSKKIGASLVWFAPQQDATPATATDNTPPADKGGAEGERADEDAIHTAVQELQLEGNGKVLEARKDALIAIVTALREQGTVTAGDLKDLVDADAVGYTDADSFWSNIRRQDVFNTLPVETPGPGGQNYTYTGDDLEG